MMRIFIAHAEDDAAVAADLKAVLKQRGLIAETETGARGFLPLLRGDAVIGLWSQKSVFSRYRMLMEKRLLDAWAEDRLVLVKLDHGVLPVGLRDLPAIDASFEPARKLNAWPAAERQARAALRRSASGARSGAADEQPTPTPPPAIEEAVEPTPPRRSPARGSQGLPMLAALAIAAVGAGGLALALNAAGETYAPVIIGAAALIVLVLLVWAVFASLKRRASAPSAATGALPPAASATAQAPAPAQEAADSPVFVSYAHADASAVAPVVETVKAGGQPVWIDTASLAAGDGWAGEIVRGIKSASQVMVMCSARSFESDHVKREVYLADRYKKPMLPVFLEQTKLPEDFEFFFAGVQWLELFKLPEAERGPAVAEALRRDDQPDA